MPFLIKLVANLISTATGSPFPKLLSIDVFRVSVTQHLGFGTPVPSPVGGGAVASGSRPSIGLPLKLEF